MKKLIYHITGIIILLAGVLLILYYSFTRLTKKSFYEESGKINTTGISAEVEIKKDSYGVPHITAKNEADLFYAMGYIHAQDRLWQMDLTRRVAEGRLSEILGIDALEYDKLFRTIGIGKYSYEQYKNISPKSKEILEYYTNGVNAFISKNNKKLPLEFDILNYKPEEWKPENSLMAIRMMGWELNISWMTEFMFGQIVNKFGLEKARDFFPDYPEDAPYIVKTDKEKSSSINIKNLEKYYSTLYNLGNGFYDNVLNYRDYFNIKGTHIGSNSWVVSGKKTERGKPIIANDPHLVLQAPSRWYEIVLNNSQDGIKAMGFSIPGVPGIAIGSNTKIAWGITNLMNDDSDFLILQRDTIYYNKYLFKDSVYPIDSTEEYIKIKDVKDEYLYMTHHTAYGPVISDLQKTGFYEKSNFSSGSKYLVTFKWTGYEYSDELKCFYDIIHSQDWNSFRASLKNFGLPASNFTYADMYGNIGYQAAGKIPIREHDDNFNASIPNTTEINWKGYIDFNSLPFSYNPENNFIVTANNKPDKEYKYYISNLYEPPYRAMRIEEVLKSKNNITAQEFKLLQNDYVSLQAKEFLKYVIDAFKDSTKISEEEYKIINNIKRWNYDFNKLNWMSSVFAEYEICLYKNLYKNVMGENLFKDYIFVNNIPVRNTAKLLKADKSWLFSITDDDSLYKNAKTELIRRSFREAIDKCKKRFNTDDFEKWEWGIIHKVMIKHPLGIVPSLEKFLNIGPYEVSGLGTTVSNMEYSFIKAYETDEFETFIGPSLRFIYDFNEGDFYYSILPSGQSGQSQHPNYSDQSRLWINAEYKQVYYNLNPSLDMKSLYLSP